MVSGHSTEPDYLRKTKMLRKISEWQAQLNEPQLLDRLEIFHGQSYGCTQPHNSMSKKPWTDGSI